MFQHIRRSVQQAFFDSLEQAGCLGLETEGQDEEVEDWQEDDKEGKRQLSDDAEEVEEEGEEDDEDDDEDEFESDEEDGEAEETLGERGDVELATMSLLGTPSGRGRVLGFGNFLGKNPKTDKFAVDRVHHVEFWCPDATNTAQRLSWALGMPLVAKSDLSTGNKLFSSYVLKGGELALCFTSPQPAAVAGTAFWPASLTPFPHFSHHTAFSFIARHGLAVRAIAVEVGCVAQAYEVSVLNGARAVCQPQQVGDPAKGSSFWVAEVVLVGDVVLRFVSQSASSGTPFLPGFSPAANHVMSFGLTRLDHAVAAVEDLEEAVRHVVSFTGFHEFDAGLSSRDGTRGQGLAGDFAVLANNTESVLLPVVAPSAKAQSLSQSQSQSQSQSRSQSQSLSHIGRFLASNNGPGIQHLALMCSDIVVTVQEMRARSCLGGLHFPPPPGPRYYKDLAARLGGKLTKQQLEAYEELGILVDVDDRGILLQLFTLPVADRPTFSFEIVQRISYKGSNFPSVGCGGFGDVSLTAITQSAALCPGP